MICFNLCVSFGSTFVETPCTTHPPWPPRRFLRCLLTRHGGVRIKGLRAFPSTSFEENLKRVFFVELMNGNRKQEVEEMDEGGMKLYHQMDGLGLISILSLLLRENMAIHL